MPLHIAHTESSCGWGGQEIRVLTEALGMQRRGHRLSIVCPPRSPIHAAALRMGLSATALPIARKNLRALFALRRWMRLEKPDIVNAHSSTDAWLVALARATLAAAPPLVRTRHVSTTVSRNAATRWLYQHATRHIVTTGEAVRQQLARDNGFDAARMTSVPTGIDLERFRPRDAGAARQRLGLDGAMRYVGIVATLRNWKGHTYLLDAFSSLAPLCPGWHLLIVGDGPQRRNLEARVAELGLAGQVSFCGNRDDVELWLNAMDVFALPSYGEEGVSQSVMQAMASALPVVSTQVGALAEAVLHERTGFLVSPRDAAALAQALQKLFEDEDLRRRFGSEGRRRAQERFGSERMLDAMERVFREALSPCAA